MTKLVFIIYLKKIVRFDNPESYNNLLGCLFVKKKLWFLCQTNKKKITKKIFIYCFCVVQNHKKEIINLGLHIL